jgi:hypothetical protein
MSTPSGPAGGQTFIVVGVLRDGTNPADLAALRADEHQQLDALVSAGRVGFHHVAHARGTVFLEVIADSEAQAQETLATLPFAQFFDPDIYAITAAPRGSSPSQP